MRSLLCAALILAACGGNRSVTKTAASMEEDASLDGACAPDWGVTPPAVCEKDEEGKTILTPEDPTYGAIAQVMTLEKEYPDSRGMDEAIVKQLTHVIDGATASPCGRQVCRWHRALALHRLGRWREAFVDFGAIVKDGPNNPYYQDVGAWIQTLEPHVPRRAYITCASAYDPAALEPKTTPTE